MNEPTLFGLYTAQFPFLDTAETKIRPVIVVSKPHGKHRLITIIPVSSQSKRKEADVALGKWEYGGLVKPSVARVHRLTTMLQSDLFAELGEVHPDDVLAIKKSLRNLLNL